MNIRTYFPTYQDLEAAPVPAVAGALLKVLLPKVRGGEGSFHIHNETLEARSFYDGRWECARAVSEAFGWLAARNLICLAPNQDAWMILTRTGLAAANVADFVAWAADRDIPETLLHPMIIQECIANFRLGKFDTAVFEAFKTLEVAIRHAAGLSASDIGTHLARKAFRPSDGPLSDTTTDGGEQQALADLMAGAIGSYKNPHSHRKQALGAGEAREMLILASHLLRIVHTRGVPPT
jgi:uncharacterized protein (TIGR02391 family)